MTGGAGRPPPAVRPRRLVINGRNTSMRLEPFLWDALEEVGRRENRSIEDLCSAIDRRLEETSRGKPVKGALTPAVRVFLASYFRQAATEDGHAAAGHGRRDPLFGTPFDEPAAAAQE